MHSYSPLKQFLRRFIPGSLLRLRQTLRNRRRTRYTEQLLRTLSGRVLAGPFAGLRYPGTGVGSAASPKLLGTYEAEIHGVITALDGGFDVVVNVGAAEGYYAVGLLSRTPSACGVAFEAEERGHPLIRELADLNGVADRLQVRGHCSAEELAATVAQAGRPVVVMDVEGAEEVLLDPEPFPDLRRAAILVEVHEYLRPGVTDRLLRWYSASHAIDRIPTARASAFSVPAVPGFSARQLRFLADEMRPARMEWFWMTPRG
jgi:hypothetical protein